MECCTHPGGGGGGCVWRGPSSAVWRCLPAGPGRGLGVGYTPLYGTPDCWRRARPGGGYHAALGPGSRGGTPPVKTTYCHLMLQYYNA